MMGGPKPTLDNLRLQAILDNAVDSIITIDESGIIETANPAAVKMFQYSLAEMVGKNVSMLMPNPYRDEHDGYLENYLTTGTRKIIGIGREVVGQRKDGTRFPMHLAVSEIEVEGHKSFTGIVRDISDLKQTQERLAEVNQQLEAVVAKRTAELKVAQAELLEKEKLATLGQVSGGIAHEIRNPLNAVKTSAYFLLHAPNPSDEKRREHLERIDRQVGLIDNVVTALSDVAKLPDANRCALNIEEMLRQTATATNLPDNVTIEYNFAEPTPEVLADPNQLPIVFRNLIRNARDAMTDGGTLTIHTEVVSAKASDQNSEDARTVTQSAVAIRFVDTGTGIPPEKIAEITKPLYTTKARGMGLGLAICKAIVDKNGGRLEIDSHPGNGSRFSVFLPTAS